MTLATSCKKLYIQEAKRNLFLPALSMFFVFVTFPFLFLIKISQVESEYGIRFGSMDGDMVNDRYAVLDEVTCMNELLFTVTVILAVINGMVIFSYLSSKKKQDFYFSQPITKSTLFFIHVLQGIMNIVIPFLVNGILVLIIAAVNSSVTSVFIQEVGKILCINFISYLSFYALTILAGVMTGKLMYHFLGTAVFLFYMPAVYYIVNVLFLENSGVLTGTLDKLLYASPVTLSLKVIHKIEEYIYADRRLFEDNYIQGLTTYIERDLLYLGVIFLIATGIAWFLYTRRNVEETGKVLAFKQSKAVIKGLLIVMATLGCPSLFVIFFDYSFKTIIIGAVFGLIVGTILIDAMLEQSWTAFVRNWKTQWIYIVLSVGIFVFIMGEKDRLSYKGFDDIPKNYTLEQALQDGCVDGCDLSSEDSIKKLDSFCEKINNGKNAKLRIVQEYYEKLEYQDYVYKDGKLTKYSEYDLFGMEYEYPYIVKIQGEVVDSENAIAYVMTDYKDMTLEQFVRAYNDSDYTFNYKYEELFYIVTEKGGNQNG